MHVFSHSRWQFRPGLSFILLFGLLGVLWIAGGASRADASGQVLVRGAAWLLLIIGILLGERPSGREAKPVAILLSAALALVLLQLVPLPPMLWQALPGREIFVEAAAMAGQDQPWRPWSISPGATLNAASSLIVPLAVLVFAAGLNDVDRASLPGLLLGVVAASTLLGLLQFSGVGFNNPLINDTAGQVSGSFANRNHFALFLAVGCLLAPVWAFLGGRRAGWRGPIALGLVLLFALTILASGSRAGLVVGTMALGIGILLSRHGLQRALGHAPRWAFPALIAAIVGAIAIFVLLSIAADRAVSIDRVFAIDPGQDMRSRGLPTVIAMIQAYFPMGSGFGGFDPMFRLHEPFDLLKITYFNHAHNDFLEIALDGGLPGVLLLVCAIAWWAIASFRAWRAGPGTQHMLPRLGSAMLLLVLIASAFDYPARTPMMMAVIVVAALWLNGGQQNGGATRSALPGRGQHL